MGLVAANSIHNLSAINPSPTIHTLGYEGLSTTTFVDLLLQSDIELVVDVRFTPLSRKKGFSKSTLSKLLLSNRIEYIHRKELGAPKTLRERLNATGDWSYYASAYLDLLESQKPVLAWLGKLLATTKGCLLCFEANPLECHRSLIAARLCQTNPNYQVKDLRTTGVMAVSRAK